MPASLYAPRSNSSSSSASPPAPGAMLVVPQPINASKGGAPTPARKYQCKMCPQVGTPQHLTQQQPRLKLKLKLRLPLRSRGLSRFPLPLASSPPVLAFYLRRRRTPALVTPCHVQLDHSAVLRLSSSPSDPGAQSSSGYDQLQIRKRRTKKAFSKYASCNSILLVFRAQVLPNKSVGLRSS